MRYSMFAVLLVTVFSLPSETFVTSHQYAESTKMIFCDYSASITTLDDAVKPTPTAETVVGSHAGNNKGMTYKAAVAKSTTAEKSRNWFLTNACLYTMLRPLKI